MGGGGGIGLLRFLCLCWYTCCMAAGWFGVGSWLQSCIMGKRGTDSDPKQQ